MSIFRKLMAMTLIWLLLFQFLPVSVSLAQNDAVQSDVSTTPLVAILVEKNLIAEDELRQKIYRYADDVQKKVEAQTIIIPISNDISPFEIYEGLAQFYFSGENNDGQSQLIGTVLIGDVPLPVVEKGKNFWASIYPYTDLENADYLWDDEKQRFVFEGRGDHEPEIWHGVIRSGKSKFQQRVYELEQYFDQNHEVHQGKEKFSKKVFYADFFRQKKVLPSLMYFKYKQWLKYAEELQYMRLTKHLAKVLLEESENENKTKNLKGYLPESEKRNLAAQAVKENPSLKMEDVLGALDTDANKLMPDLHSKILIDNFLQRYFEVHKHWLTLLHKKIGKAGRWEPNEIDTTPSLISEKDEASLLILKAFNDALETKLMKVLKEINVDNDYPIQSHMMVTYDPGTGEVTEKKELYWNGVERDANFNAEDCTLMRGYPRDDTYPFAQQVKAIQTYNVETADLCAHKSEPFATRTDDVYEGCCTKNLQYKNHTFSYDYCDTSSFWEVNPLYRLKPWHMGAQSPVFDIKGTQEEAGKMGTSGCASIMADNEAPEWAIRFPSLMIHDEPKAETLMQQSESKNTRALPVDDPRGFSFYDHGRKFHRVAFPNIFDLRKQAGSAEEMETMIQNVLRQKIKEINDITTKGNQDSKSAKASVYKTNWPGTATETPSGFGGECRYSTNIKRIDQFTEYQEWTESCSFTSGSSSDGESSSESLSSNNVFGRFYELGDLMSENVLDSVLEQFGRDKLFEALSWIDKNIEEKNRIVFEKAFSKKSEYEDFFFDSQTDGYELMEIVSEGDAEKGFKMAFAPENLVLDEEFVTVKEKIADFEYATDPYQFQFLGEDLGDAFLEKKEEDKCAKIPNKMTFWAKKLACVVSKTVTSKDTSVKVNNLGRKEKSTVVVEDKDVSLSGFQLKIEPEIIFISNTSVDPIPVKVSLQSKKGTVQKENFSTQVRLNFSSSDAERFFQISPAQSLPLTAGEATFFLVPKTSKYGGNLTVSAVIENAKRLRATSSKSVPIKIVRSTIKAYSEKDEITVNDKNGMLIKAYVKDKDGKLNIKNEERELQFLSDNGHFMGGVHTAKIENGVAQLRFFPDKKAGKGEIVVQDIKGEIPEDRVSFEILPEAPATIKINKKSEFLIEEAQFKPITASIVDEFGNPIEDLWHQVSWQTENLEVADIAQKDQDPETKGVQEVLFSGKTSLEVRSNGKKKARITVHSSLFDEGVGRAKDLKIIKDPIFDIKLNKSSISAGNEKPVEIFVAAKTKEGTLIKDDFKVNIASTLGHVPQTLELENGKGVFTFHPGIVAGEAQISLMSPGFKKKLVFVNVLADKPAKLEFHVSEAVESLDTSEKIEFDLLVLDRFGNKTDALNEEISLKITESTKHLLSIEAQKLANEKTVKLEGSPLYSEDWETETLVFHPTLNNGKTTIVAYPKGLSGTVRLIAEHKDLVGATLELPLVHYFSADDVKNLTPKSLFAFILGLDAGNPLIKENVATNLLFAGKAQTIGTLVSTPHPQFRYGTLGPSGTFSGRSKTKLNFGEMPRIALLYKNEVVAQTQILFNQTPKVFLNKLKNGVVFIPDTKVETEIHLKDRTFFYETRPLFSVNKQGGIEILDTQLNFDMKDQNILQWAVSKNNETLGTLHFKLDAENLWLEKQEDTKTDQIIFSTDDEKIIFEEIFVGNATNGDVGFSVSSAEKKEPNVGKLGSQKQSAEDALNSKEIGWDFDWKAGTLFGANNTVGVSTKPGASDAFILLGDPTLSVSGKNPTNNVGLSKDLGKPIWKSSFGSIEEILSMDINGDGLTDLLPLVDNKLFALYQTDNETLPFRDFGPILDFNNNLAQLEIIDNNPNKETNNAALDDILQLTQEGRLKIWKNKNGVFSEKDVHLDLQTPIVNIYSARLNEDNFPDMVLLDEKNKLWFLFGNETGFFSQPTFLDQFSARFENIEETFDSGESVKPTPYLDSFLISFYDIETYAKNRNMSLHILPNDRNKVIKASSKNALGLSSLLEKNYEKYFVNLTETDFFDATFDIKKAETKMQVGDELSVSFSVKSPTELKNFSFIPPSDSQWKLQPKSFTCTGCKKSPIIKTNSPEGAFEAYGAQIPERKKIIFTWKFVVTEVPEAQVFVGDFENGRDQLSDVIVQKEIDGNDSIIKYLSSQKVSYQPIKNWLVSIVPVEREEHYVPPYKSGAVETPQTQPNTAETLDKKFASETNAEISDSFTKNYTKDSDNDGIPEFYDLYPKTENSLSTGDLESGIEIKLKTLDNARSNFVCGSGNCASLSVSRAFFAPGLINDYENPVGKENGFPTMQFLTTKWVKGTPIPSAYPPVLNGMPGPDNPDTCSDGVYPSFGRLYNMPTTTAQMGVGFCTGMYQLHMLSPTLQGTPDIHDVPVDQASEVNNTASVPDRWIPNCYVSISPMAESGSSCPNTNTLGNAELLSKSLASTTSSTGVLFNTASKTKPNEKGSDENIQIPGTDPISDWVNKQNRAFNEQVQLSTNTFNAPNLEFKTNAAPSNDGHLETLINELNNSPFIDIKTKKVTVSIPAVSDTDMGQLSADMKEWNQTFETKLAPTITDLQTLETRLSEAQSTEMLMQLKTKLSRTNKTLTHYQTSLSNQKNIVQTQLQRFLKDHKKYCLQNTKSTDCSKASLIIKQTKQYLTHIDQQLSQLKKHQETLKSLQTKIQKMAVYNEPLKGIKTIEIKATEIKETMNSNVLALAQYQNFDTEKLVNYRTDLVEKLSELTAFTENASDFFTGWLAENNKRLEEQKITEEVNQEILKNWQRIPQIFIDFTDSCQTCAVDRGTLFPWLVKLFLGNIDLPVIQLKKSPDVTLDMSNVSYGMDVTIPDMEVREIDMDLLQMPTIDFQGLDYLESVSQTEIKSPDYSKYAAEVDQYLESVKKHSSQEVTFFKLPTFTATGKLLGTIEGDKVYSDFPPHFDKSLPQTTTVDTGKINQYLSSIDASLDQYKSSLRPLPTFPEKDLNIDFPPFSLPQLPMQPPAQKLPNILPISASIVEVPTSFLELFCLLRLGAAPVPEWYLKPYVEQLTNRTELSRDLDFDVLSLPKTSFDEKNLNITGKLDFKSAGFDPLLENTHDVSKTFDNVIDVSSSKEGGTQIPSSAGTNIQASISHQAFVDLYAWKSRLNDEIKQAKDQFSSPETLVTEMKRKARKLTVFTPTQQVIKDSILALKIPQKNDRRAMREQFQKSMQQNSQKIQQVKNQIAWENKILKQYAHLEPQKFLAQAPVQKILRTMPQYLVSHAPTPLEKLETTVPTTKELKSTTYSTGASIRNENASLSDIEDLKNMDTDIKKGIFYKPHGGEVGTITDFPIHTMSTQVLIDRDNDQNDEIFYSIDDELYMKTRITVQKEKPVYQLKTWTEERFKDLFVSVKKISVDNSANGKGINFSLLDSGIPYFEWVLSDRAEILSEIAKPLGNRKSKTWERHAFVPKVEKNNKIESLPVVANSVTGSPEITTSTLKTIEVSDDCDFRFTRKNYFVTPTTFIGRDQKSHLRLNVSRSWGRLPETQEIILNKNETITLNRGQICLLKGGVAQILEDEIETRELKSGEALLPHSKIKLKNGEKVELVLKDGSKNYLFENETYHLHDFDPRKKGADYFEFAHPLHQYGFFLGIKENKRSAVHSKLLHNVPLKSNDE